MFTKLERATFYFIDNILMEDVNAIGEAYLTAIDEERDRNDSPDYVNAVAEALKRALGKSEDND